MYQLYEQNDFSAFIGFTGSPNMCIKEWATCFPPFFKQKKIIIEGEKLIVICKIFVDFVFFSFRMIDVQFLYIQSLKKGWDSKQLKIKAQPL